MLEVFRSSVNTWDCDHMGHMNVRHYFGRANEGLAVWLQRLGLGPRRLREQGFVVRARDQHLRFSRELRPGAGFSIHAGALAESAQQLSSYEELRTARGEVSATIATDCQLLDAKSLEPVPWPDALLQAARAQRCELPSYAAPRGVVEQAKRARISRDEALKLGMMPGYLGTVRPEDCDEAGLMREAACMGKIADGIAHFFQALQDGPRPSGIGGAALEYRFVFHAWPRLSDTIEVRSALSGLGPKTTQITHYLFDLETGSCFAGSQAVVVWFDLEARKAVPIPPETHARMQSHLLTGLTL